MVRKGETREHGGHVRTCFERLMTGGKVGTSLALFWKLSEALCTSASFWEAKHTAAVKPFMWLGHLAQECCYGKDQSTDYATIRRHSRNLRPALEDPWRYMACQPTESISSRFTERPVSNSKAEREWLRKTATSDLLPLSMY